MILNEHLATLLCRLGWSGRHLAVELGAHHNLPNAWLQGRTEVPQIVLEWLADLVAAHEARPAPDGWRVRKRKS